MIYGIDAADYLVPTAGYNASAVHFDGTTSLGGTLSCTNNHMTAFSMWMKPTTWTNGGYMWSIDRTNLSDFFAYNGGNMEYAGAANNSVITNRVALTISTVAPPGEWHHFIGALDAGLIAKLYKDRVSIGTQTVGTNDNFLYNTKDVWIGDDGWDEAFFYGDMADVSLWPGIDFLDTAGDIPSAILDLFIDGSLNPVDPSVAIAALGTPAVMLTGGPATFATNSLGSSGAFSVANGNLSGATGP